MTQRWRARAGRIWREVGTPGGRAHDGMIMGGDELDAPDEFR